MFKTFSKILIIFTLTLFLFSGVSFDLGRNNININLKRAQAIGPTVNPNVVRESQRSQKIIEAQNINCKNKTGQELTDCNETWKERILLLEDIESRTPAAGTNWEGFVEYILKTVNIAAGIFKLPSFLVWYGFLYTIAAQSAIWLGISAFFFTGSLVLSIQNFSSIVNSIDIISLWSFFRDIINVCFIFLILYESIKIIIGKTSNKSKTTIVNIIVSATLINFSLFFTKVIIDAGNMFAVSIYNLSGGTFSTFKDIVMQSLSIGNLLSFKNIAVTGQMSTIFMLSLQIILQLTLLWAFFTAALLFIGRAVVLIFLLVTSPIGYLQDVLPQLSEHSKKWRKTLLDQVLLAPIFMLCLLIINSLLKNISTITGFSKENFNITVAVRPADTMNTEAILGYIFIIFALIYSVKITKKMSGVVAEYVNKVTGLAVTAAVVGLTAGAGAITAGGTALVSRGAVTAVGAGRLARAGRSLQYGAGVGMMKFGNVASGQAFKDAAGKPTALGVALTNAQKSVFGTVKKQTGVDLDSAIKYRENREKEYEKRYGEIANKIGGKKEIEELKVLNDISTNIKNQGESRARKEKKAEWDNVNNMPDIKDQEKKDKAEAKRKLQKETEDRGKQLAKAVAAEMGVDLAKHEAKKDELKITIERKTKDKNEYAANIPKRHKKIADRIRSQATYETKDKVEDDFIKMIKKIGFEKKGESTESKPKV